MSMTYKNSDITGMRVRANFDHKYTGGVDKLMQMIAATPPPTLQELANYYGISRQRVAIIVQDILGKPYSEYLAERNIARGGMKRAGE